MSIRQAILEVLDSAIFLEPEIYDAAIIGVTERACGLSVVAYDKDVVIEVIMQDGLSYDEANEYFYYNIVGMWVGDDSPVFVDQSFVSI